jgi:uncharacterized protein (TIGR03086 family)
MEANARHDLSGYDEFMADDIVVTYQDGRSQVGREAVRRGMRANIEAMPDYAVEVEDQVATNDRVICRWRVSGTPVSKGTPVEITGVSYWEFEGGKATRGWAYAGTSTLADQIGATDPAQRFIEKADAFAAILDSSDQQWDAPTPCDGWTVRDIVGHVIDTERDFLARQGLDPGEPVDLADPASAWRGHAARVAEILDCDDVAGREYDGYFGRTTIAATMADFYGGWHVVIHGSDIARATGQPWSISNEEAKALHATADAWGEALYSQGVCGAAVPVPDDATATDRLLARLGRDPGWRPTLI